MTVLFSGVVRFPDTSIDIRNVEQYTRKYNTLEYIVDSGECYVCRKGRRAWHYGGRL